MKKSKVRYSFNTLRSTAAQAFGMKEGAISRVAIRYRARKGSLIREKVFVPYADIIKLLALETITHRRVPMRAAVRVFAPSRGGIRTLSNKGLLTVGKGLW